MTAQADIPLESFLPRFGLAGFRSGQREVIAAVLAGHDCLCVMPTGGGKSLCYQLPAVAGEGLTLVVSPLIALPPLRRGSREHAALRTPSRLRCGSPGRGVGAGVVVV